MAVTTTRLCRPPARGPPPGTARPAIVTGSCSSTPPRSRKRPRRVVSTSKRHAKEDTMAPEQLLEQIKRCAQAFAQGMVCKTLLDLADTDVERVRRQTEFEQWD